MQIPEWMGFATEDPNLKAKINNHFKTQTDRTFKSRLTQQNDRREKAVKALLVLSERMQIPEKRLLCRRACGGKLRKFNSFNTTL